VRRVNARGLTARTRLAILDAMGRWIVLAVIAVASQPAFADSSSRAKELFEEGQELAKQGKWLEACTKFSESNKLERAVGTSLNLADCLVHVGKLADAWKLFDEGAAELERAGKTTRAQLARGRADELSGKLATLTVKISQSDVGELTLTIAGRDVTPKPEVTQRLDPGTIVVTAAAPRRDPFKTTVTIPAGGAVTVEVPAFAPVHPNEEPTPAPTSEPGPRRRSRVYLAGGLGVAGIATAITGGVIMQVAQNHYDDTVHSSDCISANPPMCYPPGLAKIADAQSLLNAGEITLVVGIIAVAAGGVVYFTAPREQVTVMPVANAHGAGLTIGGSF
jgi:hypothetical protein